MLFFIGNYNIVDLRSLTAVPDSDLFEEVPVPELCQTGSTSQLFHEEGVYLAMLQRREIINLNSKYMIKMAESRGLFGASMSSTNQGTGSQQTGVKRTKRSAKRCSKPTGKMDVDRIAAHTHCSLMRTHCYEAPVPCPKHSTDESSDIVESPAKRWWAETTRYLTRLRRSLIRQKLLSSRPTILNRIMPDGKDVEKELNNIDEILNKVNIKTKPPNGAIPPFPRLRLSRKPKKKERIPFPLYNCSIELPK